MLKIRSFLNADLPYLADIWCIHHATYRSPPLVNHSVFEQAVASRLFFDPSRLLVATNDDRPVAWCHWFPESDQTASLEAFCFLPETAGEDAVPELLQNVERNAAAALMTALSVGVHFQSRHGYQGLDPVGHGLGVDVADDRTNTLLEALGYHETKRFDRWEVSTSGYRPPVNRDLLTLRRTTKIKRESSGFLPPDVAAGMIHLEIERQALIDLRTNIVLATVDLWTSDPEALVMPMSEAILGGWSHPSQPTEMATNDIPLRYLISSVIPMLQDRRIRSLQRSVATDNTSDAATLVATSFSRTSAGRLLHKRL